MKKFALIAAALSLVAMTSHAAESESSEGAGPLIVEGDVKADTAKDATSTDTKSEDAGSEKDKDGHDKDAVPGDEKKY